MTCFACGSAPKGRYTLNLDGIAIEDKPVCEVCVSDFQLTDWIDVSAVTDSH